MSFCVIDTLVKSKGFCAIVRLLIRLAFCDVGMNGVAPQLLLLWGLFEHVQNPTWKNFFIFHPDISTPTILTHLYIIRLMLEIYNMEFKIPLDSTELEL